MHKHHKLKMAKSHLVVEFHVSREKGSEVISSCGRFIQVAPESEGRDGIQESLVGLSNCVRVMAEMTAQTRKPQPVRFFDNTFT